MKRYRILSVLFVLALVSAGLAFSSPGNAQQPNRVGMVVQYLDGTLEKRCVEIPAGEVKGSDVLRLSGLEIQFEYNSGIGSAVCKIGRDGCSADNCFCDMPNYWSYWHMALDANNQWRWVYSQLGASNTIVQPGQVEGWHYGLGQPPDQLPGFEEICAIPTPTLTNTPEPSATPTDLPTSTATASPTAIPPTAPPATATPTATSAPVAAQPSAAPVGPKATRTPRPTSIPTVAANGAASPAPATATPQAATAGPSATALLPSPTPSSAASQPVQMQSLAGAAATLTFTPAWTPTAPPLASPTEKPRRGKKATPAPEAVLAQAPVKQADQSTPVQMAVSPELKIANASSQSAPAQPAPAQAARGATWKTLTLLTGGLAGLLSFLAFFGLLTMALVIVLVRKRS